MNRDQASQFIQELLKLMVNRNGSDLFITAEFPPAIKVDGKVNKVSAQPLSAAHTLALVRSIAQRHAGDVRCVEHEGGGACFVVRLPLA